jgi:hypothetical protein
MTQVAHFFYHDCLPEDVAFAQAHLSWQATSALATPVRVTQAGYGAIPKVYILCNQAKDLDKSSLAENVACQKVYTLASGHSPFFSMPDNWPPFLKSNNVQNHETQRTMIFRDFQPCPALRPLFTRLRLFTPPNVIIPGCLSE